MDTTLFYFASYKAIQKYLAHPFKTKHSKPIIKKEKLLQNRSFFLEETGLFQFSFFINNVLRATGSNFLISSLPGIVRLFLVVV